MIPYKDSDSIEKLRNINDNKNSLINVNTQLEILRKITDIEKAKEFLSIYNEYLSAGSMEKLRSVIEDNYISYEFLPLFKTISLKSFTTIMDQLSKLIKDAISESKKNAEIEIAKNFYNGEFKYLDNSDILPHTKYPQYSIFIERKIRNNNAWSVYKEYQIYPDIESIKSNIEKEISISFVIPSLYFCSDTTLNFYKIEKINYYNRVIEISKYDYSYNFLNITDDSTIISLRRDTNYMNYVEGIIHDFVYSSFQIVSPNSEEYEGEITIIDVFERFFYKYGMFVYKEIFIDLFVKEFNRMIKTSTNYFQYFKEAGGITASDFLNRSLIELCSFGSSTTYIIASEKSKIKGFNFRR